MTLSESPSPAAAGAASCNCEWELSRLALTCQQFAQMPTPPAPGSTISSVIVEEGDLTATPTSTFLSTRLALANNLIQHWSALNGCPNVDTHISPHTLCTTVDGVDFLLRGLELAIEAINRPLGSIYHHSRSASAGRGADTIVGIRATIGRLELDSSEAAIVVQESLKHSLLRLATVSQDVAEEAASIGQRLPSSTYALKERDIKGLITRLFVALASVDRMST